jgi:hypothetical protein
MFGCQAQGSAGVRVVKVGQKNNGHMGYKKLRKTQNTKSAQL